jgi:hypothetical protein
VAKTFLESKTKCSQVFVLTVAAINKQELIKNISQFEFIKPSKALFLRYGKEKYRQDCF